MYDHNRNADNAADLFHTVNLDGSARPPVPPAPTPSAKEDMMQTRYMDAAVPPMDSAPMGAPAGPRGSMSPPPSAPMGAPVGPRGSMAPPPSAPMGAPAGPRGSMAPPPSAPMGAPAGPRGSMAPPPSAPMGAPAGPRGSMAPPPSAPMGAPAGPRGSMAPPPSAPMGAPAGPRGSMAPPPSAPMGAPAGPRGSMAPPPSAPMGSPRPVSHESGKSLLQIQIYTRKFWRTLKKESIISIIIGMIITLLVMYVTKDGMFEKFESTKSGLFALICVCVWLGIFNSIQLVCREKNDIVKDELDKSLHATSYMAAHFIYQAVLCAIQSALVFIIFLLFVSPDGNLFAYFITIYLVMFASDAMAFVLSAAVPNPIVAMTFMPLLLLIQLVMAGVMFELKGLSDIMSYFTVSRWGMSAFGLIGNIDALPSRVSIPGMDYNPLNETDKAMYGGGSEDLVICTVMFLVFIAVFYFLSVLALKLTTRRIKK